MRLEKKKMVTFVAGVMVLTLVGSTWAYFTDTQSIENPLHTGVAGGAKTIEEFTPDQKMLPGEEITKAVGVANTGDYDLVVRIKFDETWWRDANANSTYDAGEEFKQIASTGAIDTVVESGTPADTWTATQDNDTDGLVGATDETVVYKTFDMTDWEKGTDGYFYYTGVLGKAETTSDLLKAIRLASNTDMGNTVSTEYYSTVPKATIDAAKVIYNGVMTNPASTQAQKDQAEADLETAYAWSITKPANVSDITYQKVDNAPAPGAEGYSDAQYILTVTTEVLQATAAAVDGTPTWAANVPAATRTAWGF